MWQEVKNQNWCGVLSHQRSRSDMNVMIYARRMAALALVFSSASCGGGSGDSSGSECPSGFALIPGMVAIPAGSFLMGASGADEPPYYVNPDEGPVHLVSISKCFWIGAFEVTQSEFSLLMGYNPSEFLSPNNPVDMVTRTQAEDYCAALNAQQTAIGGVPAGYVYRLPTEAEWEYACRAGTVTAFHTGVDLACSQANFEESDSSGLLCNNFATKPVGTYQPNPWGLYDMHGNVWEWCLGSYGNYSAQPATDPLPMVDGAAGVLRGGSWYKSSSRCRSAYRRTEFSPDVPDEAYGFRVVLGPILQRTTEPQVLDGFVLVPSGSFAMGSSATAAPFFAQADEAPVHAVTLSRDFWVKAHEVTQGEFVALMGYNPSAFVGANRPVERISWFEAQAYCDQLHSMQSVLGLVPAGYRYRLPTEAEWEYACRGGTSSEFHTGSILDCSDATIESSDYDQSVCGSATTTDVGQYPPNAFGLYDMHGNVWEWCFDSVSGYPSTPVVDPFVNDPADARILRGGSWYKSSSRCRSAYRRSDSPGTAYDGYGLRVVLAPELIE